MLTHTNRVASVNARDRYGATGELRKKARIMGIGHLVKPSVAQAVHPVHTPPSVGLPLMAPHSCAAEDSITVKGVAGLAWATAELLYSIVV